MQKSIFTEQRLLFKSIETAAPSTESVENFTIADQNRMFEQFRKGVCSNVRTEVHEAVKPTNQDQTTRQLPDRENCYDANFYPF